MKLPMREGQTPNEKLEQVFNRGLAALEFEQRNRQKEKDMRHAMRMIQQKPELNKLLAGQKDPQLVRFFEGRK